MLTDRSRDDSEVTKIADMVSRFDVVAIQEARDTRILDRINAQLEGWTYIASNPVGRGQKEIYAFFWRESNISQMGRAAVIKDPEDLFIREPYTANFRAAEFDFTLCTIHLLYGKSKRHRRAELMLIDEVAQAVQDGNGAEQDVIILGDFNFPPDDFGWQLSDWLPLFRPPAKTTIGDKSLYDNIWFDPIHDLLPAISTTPSERIL